MATLGEVLTMGPNEEPVANYMTRGAYGDPRSSSYAKSLVTVYAPNGVPFQVHREAAPAFQGFVNELAGSGYQIRPADSGGYNLRTKRGGTSLSQHAFGNAVDINWSTNPMQRKLQTDMPDNVTEMAAKWGLEWGGNWRGKKDAMHFEWTGVPVMPGVGALRSKEDIKAAQQALAAQGLYTGEIDGEAGPLTRKAIASLGPGTVGPAIAPQDAQSAIASLVAPAGGTQTPEMPSPLMAFNPGMPEVATPGAQPSGPPMPPDPSQYEGNPFGVGRAPPTPAVEPTPQWAQNGAFPPVAGNAEQNTMLGGTTPPMPQLRNQAAFDQQKADQLDQVMFGAGPHRGDFARGRPEGRWLEGAGGAPDASAVPTPNISPLTPAVGGPNDRRPQPPMPSMRPEGRFVAGAGGAPDAGSVPSPSPRGTPYAPTFPDLYGEQPQYRGGLSAEMGNTPPQPPGRMPMASREVWNEMGLGSRGNAETQMSLDGPPRPQPLAVPKPAPAPDEGSLNLARDLRIAREQTSDWTGDLRPQSSPPPAQQYAVGNLNYDSAPSAPPPPAPIVNARTKDDAYTPAPYAPDFNFAGTPSASGPQSGAMTGEGAPSAPNWQSPPGVSGMTYAPPMPAPPATSQMARDQFNLSFSPGGPGMIAGLSGPRPAPEQPASDPFAALFGPGAAVGALPFTQEQGRPVPGFDAGRISDAAPLGGVQGAATRSVGSPADANFWNTAPAADLGLTGQPSPPMPSPQLMSGASAFYRPDAPDPTFAGGTAFTPSTPKPGDPGVSSPMAEGPMDIRPQIQGGPPMPAPAATLPQPPPSPTQTTRGPGGGIIGRILGGLLAGPAGAIGGGLLGGGGGGFGFGTPASFTPYGSPVRNTDMGSFRTSGTSPYGNNGGSTQWQSGTSNALGGSNALSWKTSNGGTITAYTDPNTGQTFHSYG